MSQKQIDVLPGTEIPIHCFRCKRKLEPEEVNPNPFPTPVDNRQEWFAFAYKCAMCGAMGTFQYRVKEEDQE